MNNLTTKNIDGVVYVKLSEIQKWVDELQKTLKPAKEEQEKLDKSKQREKTFISATCTMCKRTYTHPSEVEQIQETDECFSCSKIRADLADRWSDITVKYGK